MDVRELTTWQVWKWSLPSRLISEGYIFVGQNYVALQCGLGSCILLLCRLKLVPAIKRVVLGTQLPGFPQTKGLSAYLTGLRAFAGWPSPRWVWGQWSCGLVDGKNMG